MAQQVQSFSNLKVQSRGAVVLRAKHSPKKTVFNRAEVSYVSSESALTGGLISKQHLTKIHISTAESDSHVKTNK